MTNDYFRRVNPDLLRFLPPDANLVVEVGCGAGALAAEYRRVNPGVRYVGVEAHAGAAAEAREHLDHVLCGSVERVARPALTVGAGAVDVLVFGDVLEHLNDPWAVLRRFAPLLSPGGQVVACVPNTQHASLIAKLMRGEWKYEAEGLLDRTHLRFFTLDTLVDLFAGAGLRVFDARPRVFPSPELDRLLDVLTPTAEALGAKPATFRARASAFQYIVRATRADHAIKPLLIQTQVGCGFACGPVRVTEPDEFLNTVPGVTAVSGNGPIDLTLGDGVADKVFVWQRVPLAGAEGTAAQRELVRRGYVTVYELDDDPNHPNLVGLLADDGFALRSCHAVQTSTEELAGRLRRFNPNVVVFPNQIARLPAAKTAESGPSARGPVTVFFGALNREPDWAALMPAVNRVARRFGDRMRFRVVYDRMFFDALESPHKAFTPGCDRDTYLRELAASEVALLPLSPTPFNQAKSDLKFAECAAHGAVVLASPTVYAGSVAEGRTGLLFANAREFEAKLTRLVEDADLRTRLSEAALAEVRDRRMLGRHFRRRLDWYRELVGRREELTAELRARVPSMS